MNHLEWNAIFEPAFHEHFERFEDGETNRFEHLVEKFRFHDNFYRDRSQTCSRMTKEPAFFYDRFAP